MVIIYIQSPFLFVLCLFVCFLSVFIVHFFLSVFHTVDNFKVVGCILFERVDLWNTVVTDAVEFNI